MNTRVRNQNKLVEPAHVFAPCPWLHRGRRRRFDRAKGTGRRSWPRPIDSGHRKPIRLGRETPPAEKKVNEIKHTPNPSTNELPLFSFTQSYLFLSRLFLMHIVHLFVRFIRKGGYVLLKESLSHSFNRFFPNWWVSPVFFPVRFMKMIGLHIDLSGLIVFYWNLIGFNWNLTDWKLLIKTPIAPLVFCNMRALNN